MTMTFRTTIGLLPLVLMSCDPFNNLPNNADWYLDEPLWDADVAAAIDGIYVRLPAAGELIRIADGGAVTLVDLDGARPTRLLPVPGDADGRLLVFAEWPSCPDDDPEIITVDDCIDEGEKISWKAEIAVVQDGRRLGAADIPSHMNAVAFSPDGSTAVAYLDPDTADLSDVEGIIDLTEVVFIPMDGGATQSVSIGFSPSNILFDEASTKAVIMSRSKVVVVDIETGEKVVEYPLTLDADQVVDPSDAVLTPDGEYVLVSIEGANELYKLNLLEYSIDIEDLDAPPADLAVDAGIDSTLIVYSNLAKLDVLSHDDYELEDPAIQLDDPVTGILLHDGEAVLYNNTGASVHDVYRLNLETRELTEFVVGNPVSSMQISPDGAYAVGILRPETTNSGGIDGTQDANWGMSVIEMGTDSDDAVSLILGAEPVGLALTADDSGTYALLLLSGEEYLLHVDLSRPSAAQVIDLPAPPTGIGETPDGEFYITHESPLGLVSMLDPTTLDLTTTAGFAAANLLAEDTLPRRGEEN
jgi:DNA-binding beta-propeller fold protein YncE